MTQAAPKNKATAYKIKQVPIRFGEHGHKLMGKILLPEIEGHTLLPGAVICHGFGCDYRAVESSARIMASQGITVLIFDFRGHGLSEGVVDGSQVQDIVDAYNYLGRFPGIDRNRIGLVGHSLGAMSAIMAAKEVESLRALVALSCPPQVTSERLASEEPEARPGFKGTMKDILKGVREGVTEHPRHGPFPFLSGISAVISVVWMYLAGYSVRINWQKFFESMPRMRMASVLQGLENCRKLFVFCEGDAVTPYQDSIQLYEKAAGPKKMFLAKGGFHSTPLFPGRLRTKWTNWMVAALTAKV